MEPNTRNTLTKAERLCSKTELDRLFANGTSVFEFPFKFIFLPFNDESGYSVQVVFSVPKRTFKRAVKRNLLKRRMREAYRLNKQLLYEPLKANQQRISLMIIYVDKEVKNYATIEKGMIKGMKKVLKKLPG